jgi:curved DNA-binding protein CbpA
MSEELTHYDVLGVEPTANKDDIRAAYQGRLGEVQADISREQASKKPDADAVDGYRREEARVRSAWQVLSDPYQRGRYDVTIESAAGAAADDGAEYDDDDAGDEDDHAYAELTPRARARQERLDRAKQARSGPQRLTMLSTERPPTPPSWPPGLVPPPPRARTMAMIIDIFVLYLMISVGSAVIGTAIIDQAFPGKQDKISNLNDKIDSENSKIDDKNSNIDDLNSGKVSEADKTKITTLKSDVKTLEADKKANEKQRDKLIDDIAPGTYGVLAGIFLAMLLYLIPSSAITGRTLGKRLFWIRAVRTDGSRLGWGPAFQRYAPIAIIAVVAQTPVLGILGIAALAGGLFAVLSWPRNPNLQGVQDRIAKTYVVDG